MCMQIIGGRSTGKTAKLIQTAAENPNACVILCKYPEEIREKIHALGYGCITDKIYPITYEKYIYDDYYDNGYDVYIDEVEEFLQAYDPMIKGYALSLNE